MNGQIDNLPPLREVIEQHGLRARKALGQNFLLDLNLTAKIARQAGPLEGRDVIEIGPGPGGLTRAILAAGACRVTAIERDRRCLPALEAIAARYPGRLEIVEGDALTIDMRDLGMEEPRIIANLPYNVATPLLIGWLAADPWPPFYDSMTLMLQREVAERICAEPGRKAYGRLSVLAQWRTSPGIVMEIGPRAFTPPPKVSSAVVHFKPLAGPLPCRLDKLEAVTRAAFGQRRKMLRAALKPLGGARLLERAGITGERRAEELEVAEFVALANAV